MRESREPLIPDQQYRALAADGADIKSVVRTLPALNRSTLQLIVRLAKALVGYESKNKMTPYNVAITLGPNIFRAKVEDPNLETHKIYYDALIEMIEKYAEIFDDDSDLTELLQPMAIVDEAANGPSNPDPFVNMSEHVYTEEAQVSQIGCDILEKMRRDEQAEGQLSARNSYRSPRVEADQENQINDLH